MKIIKKRVGYYPEILDLDKEEITSLFNSGMDKNKIVNNVYLISKYQNEKSEKTFNTSVIYPHTSIVHYYNDIYVVKKGLFGFRDLSQVEIDDILKLMKYPDNLKDPADKKLQKKADSETVDPGLLDTPDDDITTAMADEEVVDDAPVIDDDEEDEAQVEDEEPVINNK